MGSRVLRLCNDLALYVAGTFYPDPSYLIVVGLFARVSTVTEDSISEKFKFSKVKSQEILKRLEEDGFISKAKGKAGPRSTGRGYHLDFHRLVDYTEYRMILTAERIRKDPVSVEQKGYKCPRAPECSYIYSKEDIATRFEEDDDKYFCICGAEINVDEVDSNQEGETNIMETFRKSTETIEKILSELQDEDLPDTSSWRERIAPVQPTVIPGFATTENDDGPGAPNSGASGGSDDESHDGLTHESGFTNTGDEKSSSSSAVKQTNPKPSAMVRVGGVWMTIAEADMKVEDMDDDEHDEYMNYKDQGY